MSLTVAALGALAAPRNPAETAAPSETVPRVQGSVEDGARVLLTGNVLPLLQGMGGSGAFQSAIDQGAVEDSLPAGRMLLLLQRSPAQEAALRDFIQATHTPGNPSYHQWLKPAEFGRLYGPADSDVAAVAAWLESHGLTVNQVHAGRLAIEFSGSVGQVSEAFQTGIHRYLINGETHLANATDLSVPAALAPVIVGLARVNGFHPQPQLEVLGQAQFNAKTHQATPQWTYPVGSGVVFLMTPGDFAVQYDINPVYNAGITGSGQSIAIVSASNVDLSMVQAYQSLFGLSANLPQVIVDGADPGENEAATEAYLDIEIATSVAPGTTIMLYTSEGTALTDGLALAAMRAVEDDVAGVISTSYGECEQQLGQSGNAFWSALWQQAAAQGQTAFVSTGDGGSAGCDDFDTQAVAYDGLQVNGIASTPYNVAVGGTDFYYSQYASTSSVINTQLGNYWYGTTTAPAVSLKQTIPEQAWNDFFGYNLADSGNPANLGSQNIIAGSGGASSAALYPNGTGEGYPKPAWQTGTGVPADGVRDLPDVSLFAANGYNYSFYPICALPGDCSSANLNSNGTEVVTGVGGTSISSPSMAAIQALVNQSTGSWQGQADFIYYPLAARQATVFHDVTVGGNRVLCNATSANCVAGSSATNSSGFNVESGYAAGAGYDLATGLGSLDVANLIKYWNTVTLTPTSATLSISPSSFAHGKSTTISGTVAPTSSSGTPTGAVNLTGNDGVTHYASIDSPTLTAGSFYALVDNLPGGTYQLTADYGGDATFAPSKSAPVTVTITPENNTLAATGWAWNPYDLNLYQLTPGITLPYGAQIYLDAQPVSGNATISTQLTPATGTVTYTDVLGTATTTSTEPLNAAGVAEWSTGVFAPGSHAVSESYSGDASYNPSSAAGAASFTVIQGSTSLTVKPLVTSVAAGASVAVDVQLTTGYLSLYGTPPTGNVTVTLGGQTANAAWQAYGPSSAASLEAVVTFNNVSAGMLPVTASYAGDSNWLGSLANGGTVIALSSKVTPTVTLSTSSASPASGQNFTLTAVVSGPAGSATPTGTVAFLSDYQSFDIAATISNGMATLTIPSYALANGTNAFTAVYQGNNTYTAASSNAVNVTTAQPDFSFTSQNAEVSISPSGSGISTLALTPINGFSGNITLSASAPAGLTASLAAASLAVNAPATDALNLNVAASMASGIYPVSVIASGGGHVHTAQILVRVLSVAAPTFSPAPGTYLTVQSITLTDATPGTTIYYTTDGTMPTTSSTRYTGVITISTMGTIQAIAVASGYAPSSVAAATYAVYANPPLGNLDQAVDSRTSSVTVQQSDSLMVSGWAADPTDGAPISNLKIYIDGNLIVTPLQRFTRPDVAAYFNNPAYTNSGYQIFYSAATLAIGTHAVTVIAIDSGGRSTTFGPNTITVVAAAPPPFGNLEYAVDAETSSTTVYQTDALMVSGWVADPTDGSPLGNVRVYVDGVPFGTPTMGLARPDVAAYYHNAAYGKSGYQLFCGASVLALGPHAVTVVAINMGGRTITFGPLTITITMGPPIGNLDAAADSTTGSTTIPQSDSLLVRGWVADPVDGAPLSNVMVYIDGSLIGTPTLGLARPDVAAYFNNPSYASSGFQLVYSAAALSAGTHAVTVVAIDSGGRSTTFGPATITVAAGSASVTPPFGNLDLAVNSVTTSTTIPQTGTLLTQGWVADLVDGAPVSNVKVYIDGSLIGTPTLGLARPDVAAYFNNTAYANSGYQIFYSAGSLAAGTHAVTVIATDSNGRSTTFGPLSITVTQE
ncbi:MAG: Ig-like domain repeat protein [Terracidiphilus sp.]